jgi:hypothetical protein
MNSDKLCNVNICLINAKRKFETTTEGISFTGYDAMIGMVQEGSYFWLK